jgi:alpha-mannosidase
MQLTTPNTSPATSPIPMIICPTSHDDWDWQMTFEQYYETAFSGYGVKGIFDSVTTIFAGTTSQDGDFRFSHTEACYLRRYLHDYPEKAAVLRAAGNRFCVLGGGITSPDNQVCHGEVFIRNYLTGHQYLKSVNLIGNVFLVAWLPDDFGHDPQLPVLLEALGMKAAALSRIPGSPQPTLCPSKQPADSTVRKDGLAFHWPGGDGSRVLTHFMPATYFGITAGETNLQDTAQSMQDFLSGHGGDTWPGGVIFATQGGDWQFPDSSVPGGNAGAYNWEGAISATVTSGDITALSQLGTFADYYQRLIASASDIPTDLLYAENYWTGYFASRPQLKIDHYQAAQWLLGAEVIGSILAIYAGTSSQDQAELAAAIARAWHLLVPTSHHDFVTGTAPDTVYQVPNPPKKEVWDSSGQLAMSSKAATLANEALNLGLSQLANTATATPQPGEIAVMVFNQIGRDLPDTAMVEMADPSGGTTDYLVRVGTSVGRVQRSSENTLLFQVPGMRSMAYQIVYLVPLGTVKPAPLATPASGDFSFSNDNTVNLVVSQSNGWAITQLAIGGKGYVQASAPANQIGIWNDAGNLYQFGMEFTTGCAEGSFDFDSNLTGGTGSLVEAGPIRWRFLGNLTDASGNAYTTQYDLIRGETLVRITTTGAAPGTSAPPGFSVLASFPTQTPEGETASVLEYGTSYFWENRDPQQSWSGLTFRASHDFAQLATAAGDSVAAVYHNGIPAWTIDGSVLRGCLLRNTPGGLRGASGSDTDSHTQSYTLDVCAQPAITGYPLRTSLYAQTRLYAAVLAATTAATMPETAQLASVVQPDAVLRVAKTDAPSEARRSLILRVQQARKDGQQLDIDLPFLANSGPVSPEIVTALETIPERHPAVSVSGTTASFTADRAVWTMKVPIGAGNAA